jgi:hypothetical protein
VLSTWQFLSLVQRALSQVPLDTLLRVPGEKQNWSIIFECHHTFLFECQGSGMGNEETCTHNNFLTFQNLPDW